MIERLKTVMMNMDKDPEGKAALKTVKMAAMPPLSDKNFDSLRKILVITSYSIHYTKLYDIDPLVGGQQTFSKARK